MFDKPFLFLSQNRVLCWSIDPNILYWTFNDCFYLFQPSLVLQKTICHLQMFFGRHDLVSRIFNNMELRRARTYGLTADTWRPHCPLRETHRVCTICRRYCRFRLQLHKLRIRYIEQWYLRLAIVSHCSWLFYISNDWIPLHLLINQFQYHHCDNIDAGCK